jgi:hypothetical protein
MLEFLALQGAPYTYDISRLRVNYEYNTALLQLLHSLVYIMLIQLSSVQFNRKFFNVLVKQQRANFGTCTKCTKTDSIE